MDLNKLAVNESKVEEGVWIEVDDDTKLLIARIGNNRFNEVLSRLQKPYRRAIRSGTLPDSVAEKTLVKAMAEAVLLGWEGLSENGEVIPYSKQKCIEILSDKKYKDFRDFVVDVASDAEQYKEQEVEEAEGN